jgi:transcription elongation GreA/GreB family factor
MSRAFVKEDDAAPEPPPPERPISAAPNRVTPRGAEMIRRQVNELKEALAQDPGDDVAATIRRDLRYWQSRQGSMQVMTPEAAPQSVGFGCRVTVQRGGAIVTVTIVGEDEANPAAGTIAWTAPLAKALEGAEPNDAVELDAGGRRETITVVSIASGA